jgi:hypothetical protein
MVWDHWWHLGILVIIAIYSLGRMALGRRGTTVNYGGQSPYSTGPSYGYMSPGTRLWVKAMWALVILGNLAAIGILTTLYLVFGH